MTRTCSDQYYKRQRQVLNGKLSNEAFKEWEKEQCQDCRYKYGMCMRGSDLLKRINERIGGVK